MRPTSPEAVAGGRGDVVSAAGRPRARRTGGGKSVEWRKFFVAQRDGFEKRLPLSRAR